MLREDLQHIIDASENSEEAAILLCKYLDDELELHGNGWFDDDELMDALLSESDDPSVQTEANKMDLKMKQILNPESR